MEDDPIQVNHKVQRSHPAGVRFCSLCGGAMESRIVLPDRKRHKACASCGFVDFLGPKLVAGCLVIKDDKLILIRRGNEPRIGKWTFPGGFVDLGETPTQAAIRETLEEVGIQVEITRLLGLYCDPAAPNAAVAVYLATAGSEAPKTSDEASEVRFFSREEIPWEEIAFRTTYDALKDWSDLSRR
jgi:ADP-ribose pyrophosphatase YjhB (NUDIX family)